MNWVGWLFIVSYELKQLMPICGYESWLCRIFGDNCLSGSDQKLLACWKECVAAAAMYVLGRVNPRGLIADKPIRYISRCKIRSTASTRVSNSEDHGSTECYGCGNAH